MFSSHFCSNGVFAKVTFFVVSILRPGQLDHYGPPRVVSHGAPSRWMGEGVARTSLPLRAVAHGIKEHDGWRLRNTIVGGGVRDLRWDTTKSRASKPHWVLWVQKTIARRANSGSAQARQGGSSGSACQPGHCQGRGSRQGGTTPEGIGCIGRSWWTRGRRHQESSQEGSGGRTRTTHCRTHQGVHQSFDQAHLKVKDGAPD